MHSKFRKGDWFVILKVRKYHLRDKKTQRDLERERVGKIFRVERIYRHKGKPLGFSNHRWCYPSDVRRATKKEIAMEVL